MNKKEEKWRIEGALYALRLAKEKGIDYLQEDIKRRGALGLSLQIPEKAAREAYDLLAKNAMNTMKTVALWTLYTEYGWKSIRLKRFEENMDKHSAMCMEYDRYGKNYVKLSDMAKELQEVCGIAPDLETLEKIERENEEARGQFLSLEAVMEALEKCGYTDVAERLLKEIS